jgi:beta-phosphoglucomutase-like phosphatase (HAD superfamily)
MSGLDALLWDVDGTVAETERDGHRVAFNRAFEEAGLPWRWSVTEYGQLLRTAGGRERLLAYFEQRQDAPADPEEREEMASRLHRRKNAFYAERVRRQSLPMRAGVRRLMDECDERRVIMAITTTTGRGNLDALLSVLLGASWRRRFAAVICAEHVTRKKPDPEVFLLALRRLGVDPADAVAIEDSPAGVDAAQAAGVQVVVTRSAYFSDAPIAGALAVGPGLHTRRGWRPRPGGMTGQGSGDPGIRLDDIVAWHGEHVSHTGTGRAADRS